MGTYMKRPEEYEAIQYNGIEDIEKFFEGTPYAGDFQVEYPDRVVRVNNLSTPIHLGSWMVRFPANLDRCVDEVRIMGDAKFHRHFIAVEECECSVPEVTP